MFLRALAAIAALLLVSCGSARLSALDISPYRMEIQQGNFVSQEMVSQLKLGMSKEQVRFVLGTPLIADSFHAERWDYVFRRQKSSSKELEHHKLAVFFEGGKLVRMDSDVIPAAGADVAAVKTPEAKSEAPARKPETPVLKPETPVLKPETPVLKPETPVLKPETPVLKPETPVLKPETPVLKPETLALKPETPAATPEPQRQPTSGAVPEKSAATPEKPAAAPIPPGEGKPQEKGWWERLKDKIKF